MTEKQTKEALELMRHNYQDQAHEEIYSGCPCLYTAPCHERCTCVVPHSSRGCVRCCSYGSIEQRQKQAVALAELIKTK